MKLFASTCFGFGLVCAFAANPFLAISAFAVPSDEIVVPEQKPPDVDLNTGLTYSYSDPGKREFNKAIENSYAFAKKYKKEHPTATNLAIVSDIDETLFDNRRAFEEMARVGGQDFYWKKWVESLNTPNLVATAKFLSWARHNGFALFLITGRHENARASTTANLIRNHVAYDGLFMRPNGNKERAELVKPRFRKQIEESGFTIVVNIGDQLSDLAGGYAKDCEKLPNRIYFVD